MQAFTKEEIELIDLVEKGMEGRGLTDGEMCRLYATDPRSRVASYIRWGANDLAHRSGDGLAEIHAQIGMNASPCPKNCKFCSFAVCNHLRKERTELPVEEVVECAKVFMDQGVNLLILMATASFRFEKILERAQAVREVIPADFPLLVNCEDLTLERAKQLKSAGVNGCYHALRMREGTDTDIPEEDRLATFRNIREAGLSLQTCVEPVGPEHTPEELTYYSRIALDSGANSAGVGRRVTLPGTLVADRGMLTDLENARNVAVYRLAAGLNPKLQCAMATPLSAAAGANLSWAEVGTNPRDAKVRTQDGGRGTNVALNRRFFQAGDWEVLDGPSQGWILG